MTDGPIELEYRPYAIWWGGTLSTNDNSMQPAYVSAVSDTIPPGSHLLIRAKEQPEDQWALECYCGWTGCADTSEAAVMDTIYRIWTDHFDPGASVNA